MDLFVLLFDGLWLVLILVIAGITATLYAKTKKIEKDLEQTKRYMEELLEIQKRQGYTNNYRNYNQNYPQQNYYNQNRN